MIINFMTQKKYIGLFGRRKGFTLIELLVVISIIGVLASIVYANFGDARALARDEARKIALKELQLAIELYKAQNGVYPAQGCNTASWSGHPRITASWGCGTNIYIAGLAPDFIPVLPVDPRPGRDNLVYAYRSNGTDYKLLATGSVEIDFVEDYEDEFARCPKSASTLYCGAQGPQANTYAVYSAGAADW